MTYFKYSKQFLFVTLAVAGCTASPAAWAGTLALSTFDSGQDGWVSSQPALVTFQPNGGNPGGYLQFVDGTGDTTIIFAPSTFLGNYLTEGVTSISYDHDIIAAAGISSVGPYEINLSGPGGAATFMGMQPSNTYPTGWVTVQASVTNSVSPPSGWTLTGGTWQGLLADVTKFQIPIERVANNGTAGSMDIEGVDNVSLTNNAAVPEPSSVWLVCLGLIGGYVLQRFRRRLPD